MCTCKVGQKLVEILYLLICSFLPCLSWLLRSWVRKSRRDLRITLYFETHDEMTVSRSNVYTATEWKDILQVRLVCLGLLIFQHLKVGCQFIGWFYAVANAHSSWTRKVVKRYMHYLPICFVCGNAILVVKQITNLSHLLHQDEKTDFLRVCVDNVKVPDRV